MCSETEATEFLKEHCLTVIGQTQSRFEKYLEIMDVRKLHDIKLIGLILDK